MKWMYLILHWRMGKIKYGSGYGYVASRFLEGDEEDAQVPEIAYALVDTTVYGIDDTEGCIYGTLLKEQGVAINDIDFELSE